MKRREYDNREHRAQFNAACRAAITAIGKVEEAYDSQLNPTEYLRENVRDNRHVIPRQMAMLLLRVYADWTFMELCQGFRKKCTATPQYSVNRIEDEIGYNRIRRSEWEKARENYFQLLAKWKETRLYLQA